MKKCSSVKARLSGLVLFAFSLGCAHMSDPFISLEEVNSAESKNWVQAQNAKSQEYFSKNKFYQNDKNKFEAIILAEDRLPHLRLKKNYFYNTWKDGEHKQGLYRRILVQDYAVGKSNWEGVLDLDQLSLKEGINWVLSSVETLKNSDRVLMALSNGGSDAVSWREFDLVKKEFVTTNDFQLTESKSHLTWYDQNTVLVRDGLTKGSQTTSGYARHVRVWKRGEKFEESKIIYSIPATDVSVYIEFDDQSKKFLVLHGLTFNTLKVLEVENLTDVQLLEVPAEINTISYFKGWYILENKKSWQLGNKLFPPGSLIAWPSAEHHPSEKNIQVLFTPTKETVLEAYFLTNNLLNLVILKNIQTHVETLKVQNSVFISAPMSVPEGGTISVATYDNESDLVVWMQADFLKEQHYVLTEPKMHSQVIKSIQPRFNHDLFASHQLWATSKDGTQIPYFIIHRKDLKFDSNNPVWLSGYGGFEVSRLPNYLGAFGKIWLEKGGVEVIANIRGGGEFGPAWHQAAMLENKQKSYDDFIAVAEDLIHRKITSPAKLAIEGGSNGGLLVGAVSMQRPDLFKAVLCAVPLLDMLRYHKLLAGASWIGEYGNPEIPKQRAYLEKYSPYQNVKKGVKYPDFFLYTSTKDDRVHPGHARKMAAKLLSYDQSVVYFEQQEGGHSRNTALLEAAELYAKMTSFLKDKLGFTE